MALTTPRDPVQPRQPTSQSLARFTPFADPFAALVCSWVRSDSELEWLAPGTPPPLTPQKVLEWGKERRRRFLYWLPDRSTPVGYAELNEMPSRPDQMWVGHFIVDPGCRGRGIGGAFATALVGHAFLNYMLSDVLLVVFPQNANAIRCYERAGMTVLGREKKKFEATGREHMFLRMGLDRGRFQRLVSKGRISAEPIAFTELPSSG